MNVQIKLKSHFVHSPPQKMDPGFPLGPDTSQRQGGKDLLPDLKSQQAIQAFFLGEGNVVVW